MPNEDYGYRASAASSQQPRGMPEDVYGYRSSAPARQQPRGMPEDDYGYRSSAASSRQPRVIIDEAPPAVEQVSGHFGASPSAPYRAYEFDDDPRSMPLDPRAMMRASSPSRSVRQDLVSVQNHVPMTVPRVMSRGAQSVRSSAATTPAAPPTMPVVPPPQYAGGAVRPMMLAEQWVTSYPAIPVRTPAITYPGGVSVNFHEVAPMLGPNVAANASHRTRMIPTIESGDAAGRTLATYAACDRDLNGILAWGNGEIRDFIAEVFQQHGLSPPTESQMFALFRKFDLDRNSVLSARECMCLVDAMLRALFFLETPTPYGQPPAPIVYGQPPAPIVIRRSGQSFAPSNQSFAPSGQSFAPLSPVVYPALGAMVQPLPSVAPLALMPPPSAASMMPRTRPASRSVLPGGGVIQAEVLDGGIMDASHYMDQMGPRYPAAQSFRAGSQTRTPMPAFDMMPAQTRTPMPALGYADQSPAQTRTTMPSPMGSNRLVVASIAGFSVGDVVIVGGQEEKTVVGFSSLLIDSPLEFDYPAGTDVVKVGQGAMPSRSSLAPSQSRSALPSAQALLRPPLPSAQALLRPPQADAGLHDDDHQLLAAAQGNGSMRVSPRDAFMDERPQPMAPKPPPAKQSDIEQRLHLLEIDLDELELHPDAPDLAARWYETLRFFVSFHPHSEQPDQISLPHDPPQKTQDGKLLVSKSIAARVPTVSSGPRLSIFGGKSEEDEEKPSNNPVAEFKEPLALTLPQLDMHLVAYVWARKSSIGGAEDHLIGRSLAPLRDYKLQRRQTTWGVFDYMEGHRVAEIKVKYTVCTTPGAIQKPSVKDVKRTEVTVHWEPPLSDHGSPTVAYKVSILIAKKSSETPQWYTLCQRTKTINPSYVVTNLDGNSSYMMNIQAINKVGVGDPCEFQITTAALEADPPPKPVIQEVRDGCINVAWSPSPNDGGSRISAYKVRMRKIIGATKWNLAHHVFGPSEENTKWVDMGTVGAAQQERAEPATYDAWVGPLEHQTCEYRFQIVALSGAGVSKGSELSDPHYT